MLDEFVPPHDAKEIGTLFETVRREHSPAAIGLGRAGLRDVTAL